MRTSGRDAAGWGVRGLPIAALSLACTDPGSQDEALGEGDGDGVEGDGDGDGEGGECTQFGTPVVGLEPPQPGDDIPLPTCTEGWGNDAPLREADWAIELSEFDGFDGVVRNLPDGRILVGTHTSLRWFDGEGTQVARTELSGGDLLSGQVVIDDEGRVHAVRVSNVVVIQEIAESGIVSELEVDMEVSTTRVIGLYPLDTSDWLLVGSEYDAIEGELEAFFMVVDALGSQKLRKARPLPSTYYGYGYASPQPLAFAAFDGENLLFGAASGQWLVDPRTGSLVTPSLAVAGNLEVIATRDGFASVGQSFTPLSMDGIVELLDPFGTSLVTGTYDRVGSSDGLFVAAARPGGGVVAGGSEGVWWTVPSGRGQPVVMAVDAEGSAEWLGRLAIHGSVIALDVGGDGRVVAIGVAGSEVGSESDPLAPGAFMARWSGG